MLAADGYRQKRERRLTAKSHVASAALIADLLSMTPHAHRAKPEGQALLARRTSLDITIDVVLRLFSRDGG